MILHEVYLFTDTVKRNEVSKTKQNGDLNHSLCKVIIYPTGLQAGKN